MKDALAPFVRWADAVEAFGNNFADDDGVYIAVVKGQEIKITIGDLRRLQRAVRSL